MMSYDDVLQRIEQAGRELVPPALHWAGQMFRIKKDQQRERIHEIELEKHERAGEAADALTKALMRHNDNLTPAALGAPYVQHINDISNHNLKLKNLEKQS